MAALALEFQRDGIPHSVILTGAPTLTHLTGKDIKIAIIDTGVDGTHEALQGRLAKQVDLVNDGEAFDSHGTHVAAIAGGFKQGKFRGVAPGAILHDYRVLDSGGYGSAEIVAKAIKMATDDGCHIINMSLGFEFTRPVLFEAVRYAWKKNVIVFAAAGSNALEGSHPMYPAYYKEVISVGAIDYDFKNSRFRKAYFSTHNTDVQFSADGMDVWSAVPGNKYEAWAGTSMATPHVAGFTSLVYEQVNKDFPTASPKVKVAKIFEVLKDKYTRDLFTIGQDEFSGLGLVTTYTEGDIPRDLF